MIKVIFNSYYGNILSINSDLLLNMLEHIKISQKISHAYVLMMTSKGFMMLSVKFMT